MTAVGAQTVPPATMGMIVLSLVSGMLLPAILGVVLGKKRMGRAGDFFIGCAVMLLFAFVLEQLAHALILSSPLGEAIQSRIWLYALYGGLMAGVFEETGRLAAFTTVLRKRRDDGCALMTGAGHGGFEAFVILTLGMANNLVLALMINHAQTDVLFAGLSGAALDAAQSAVDQLINTSPTLFLAGIVERVSALAVHVSLSVLVWFSVRRRKRGLFPLAVALHMLLDMTAVLLNAALPNVWLVEAAVACLAALYVLLAVRVWKKQAAPREERTQPAR